MNKTERSLTGRIRHRPDHSWWFRRNILVLQVEVKVVMQHADFDTEFYTWRDATILDLPYLDIKGDGVPAGIGSQAGLASKPASAG